jgi:hypothetical protein
MSRNSTEEDASMADEPQGWDKIAQQERKNHKRRRAIGAGKITGRVLWGFFLVGCAVFAVIMLLLWQDII